MTAVEGGSRLAPRFAELRAEGRAALIPYVTAGYPGPEDTPAILRALADAGADVIELGVPFSDPLADGPTIQRASFEALRRGTSVARVLELLATFRRERDTPVVLFTYLNPLLRYGPARFVREAVAAGAQGVLLTDLPAGADPELERTVGDGGLDLVRLLAPTTTPERAAAVARGARGFLYYISRTGVTGARADLRVHLEAEVRALKARVEMPVAVGFGISTPEQAAMVAAAADGVVVGSAVVEAVDAGGAAEAGAFVASLRAAMDAGSGGD